MPFKYLQSSSNEDVLLHESQFHNPVLKLIDKKSLVKEAINGFFLNKNYLYKIQKVYEREIQLGLNKNPSRKSSLLMANSMVPWLPDGTEEGDYLSIDLGSTNFRVMLSKFVINQEPKTIIKYYKVPDNVRIGSCTGIFNFMANSIHNFVQTLEDDQLHNKELPLGFTFSFPMNQHTLNSATLLSWTINFDCPDAVGKDAVQLLQNAINSLPGLKVKVVAILNDVTATLASGHYLDKNCVIGFALGSGLNISYVENTSCIENWIDKPEEYENIETIDINTEFCAIGDNGSLDFIKTQFDFELDAESLFPGKNTFEKIISGSYAGDLVRRVLLDLTKKNVLFHGKITPQLTMYNFLTTVDTSMIESEEDNQIDKTLAIIELLGYKREELCEDDINIVKYICAVITIRGAVLTALGLATLINRINLNIITIAASGSTIEKHPKLAKQLIDFIRELAEGNKEINFMIINDGAGKGGALVAAIADKFYKQIELKNKLKLANAKDQTQLIYQPLTLPTTLSNLPIQTNALVG